MSEHIEVGGRRIEIGNPDKELFPREGITKIDFARYHHQVGDVMALHTRNRAMTMHRFPDGIESDGFYQKEAPEYFPDWIRTKRLDKEGGSVTHVVCDDAATLVYLADQACITPHVTLSTVDRINRPDRIVFDLDPPEDVDDPTPVKEAARSVRDLLDELDLPAFLMTTGSSGYHVVVPLDATKGFEAVRGIARRMADTLADRHPDSLTVSQRKDKREGRVFVDYLRNAYAQTTVAPYAVRALPGAPVATPIDWHELGSTDPRHYTMTSVLRRLAQKDDPWSDIGRLAIDASTIDKRLEG